MRRPGWRWLLQLCLTLVAIFLCYRLALDSAKTGASRLLSMIAIFDGSIEATDKAVSLTPNDPEAHYTRALSLVNAQRLEDALQDLRIATQLRPHHYYEWLDLGVTLDRVGDEAGAAEALRTSIQLAPSFAQPRWQLGSLLYRQGRFEEAFAEMRLAAKSNPDLLNSMVELASAAANGDPARLEAFVQPQTKRSHFELAKFLGAHGDGASAANEVKQAGEPSDDLERTLLRDTVTELLASRHFADARNAWLVTHPVANGGQEILLNGDFLEPIKQDDHGFGWQITVVPTVAVSIDPSGPVPQSMSLRLQFSGNSDPLMQPINQLVLLQPKSRYTLSFMARTEDLVSGGPPVIIVAEVEESVMKALGQSKPLTSNRNEWNPFRVDFSTDESASPVVIALQRLPCSQSPCPIFGKLWLSGFSLAKT